VVVRQSSAIKYVDIDLVRASVSKTTQDKTTPFLY